MKVPHFVLARLRLTFLFCIVLLITGCGLGKKRYIINAVDIEKYKSYNWADSFGLFPFSGNIAISSKTYHLSAGKFSISFKANGTPGGGRLPIFKIRFGPYALPNVSVAKANGFYVVNFELPKTTEGKFEFIFDDDYNSPTEDRNVFVYFPIRVSEF